MRVRNSQGILIPVNNTEMASVLREALEIVMNLHVRPVSDAARLIELSERMHNIAHDWVTGGNDD